MKKRKKATKKSPEPKKYWQKTTPPLTFGGLGGLTFETNLPKGCNGMIYGYSDLSFHPVGILLSHQLTVARVKELLEKGRDVWVLPVDTSRAIFIADHETIKVYG